MQHENRRHQLLFNRKLKSDLAFENDATDWPKYLAWLAFFFFLAWMAMLILQASLVPSKSNPLWFLQVPLYYSLVFFVPFFFSMLAARALNPVHGHQILVLIFVPALMVRVFTFNLEPSFLPLLFALGATSAGIIIAKHL